MKKITLLFLALVCTMTAWASEIDTTAVDAIYKELLANPKVTKKNSAIHRRMGTTDEGLFLETRRGPWLDRGHTSDTEKGK